MQAVLKKGTKGQRHRVKNVFPFVPLCLCAPVPHLCHSLCLSTYTAYYKSSHCLLPGKNAIIGV